jgi:hypothetical protein
VTSAETLLVPGSWKNGRKSSGRSDGRVSSGKIGAGPLEAGVDGTREAGAPAVGGGLATGIASTTSVVEAVSGAESSIFSKDESGSIS